MPTTSLAFIDSFRSKVEVIEQTSSFLRAKCPICEGNTLKMNLTESHEYYGAYRCWSNDCPKEEIRKALDLEKEKYVSSPFGKSNVFNRSRILSSVKKKAEYYPDSFDGKCFMRLENYDPAKSTSVRFGKSSQTKTVYYYSPYLRVLRLDKPGGDKKIYIQSWDSDTGWLAGSGDKIWPCYGQTSALTSCSNWSEADSVVFVEGEKCADYLRKKGCAAFTFMAAGFHGEAMRNALVIFKYFFPHIKNIVYIKDEDKAGELKENYVREGVSKVKLGYTALNLQTIFPELPLEGSGYDVVDLPWKPIRQAILNLQKT